MATTAELNLTYRTLWEIPIKIFLSVSTAVQPSWSEGGTTRNKIGRGPSNDYFIKVWFQLSNWFQTRRFLCEFPIGEPNFDGIVIRWSSSKIVCGSCALPPRWLPQSSCVVIESSFDPSERLQVPGSLWFAYLATVINK
jgi:hypothetical protein